MENNNIDSKKNNVISEEKSKSTNSKNTKIGLIILLSIIFIATIIFGLLIFYNSDIETTIAENKIYSPLSIKYALKMLEDGAEGESKLQISNIIGDYKANKYINSENMSFANAIFIKDTVKDIKNSYTNTLSEKYNAEIKTDPFSSPNNVNSWINDRTLGLINNLLNDVSRTEFLLINALAIDMDWEQKFILYPGCGVDARYPHENFFWNGDSDIVSNTFKNSNEKVAGMEILASFNNYDIVNVLGNENIRQTVKTEFKKYLNENPEDSLSNYFYSNDITDLNDEQLMEKYLDKYIEEINSNYKQSHKTTDFSLYVDDKVKVFAKDLKEYNETTLQYIGIMPINEDLDSYISNIKSSDINSIIANLKELKCENFKDGVVTKIKGFIPKFDFEYELKLKEDLKKLGITNVFEVGKANLSNISSDELVYVDDAVHKANIEFNQDGIKASAATVIEGGRGAGSPFDYLYDVPVEEIDLTFDKPYMFIIRDKKSEDVWFVGTVYNPLLYSADTTKLNTIID